MKEKASSIPVQKKCAGRHRSGSTAEMREDDEQNEEVGWIPGDNGVGAGVDPWGDGNRSSR
jgi:hypothetical protein